MATSLQFTAVYDFYLIGNTAAASLTRDLPPEVPANILLLPCGDPRNVIYTVFCEKTNILRKELDFTCCDYDPGVLARDVLLLTMIMDRVADQIIWNILFHMYLDIDSRSTLVSHSQKLAAYDSVDAWRLSPYGAIIKIGTDHTFAELQRHWDLYADFYHPSKLPRLRKLQALMDKKRKETAATTPKDSVRPLDSAGPLFEQSRRSGLLSEQHLRYWQTGTTFTDKRNLADSIHPNSTFFYSRAGEGFDVQVGTDPMVPFHHAPLFGNTNQTLTIADIVESARSQFCAWTSAFRIAATTGNGGALRVVVRFLLGDALAVAKGLRDFTENPTSLQAQRLAVLKVAQWTTRTLELNREEYTNLGAPTRFDVIDTSNVADYLGLLNIFLVTAPLLMSSPSSVLYTESFPVFAPNLRAEFEATMFASLSAVAILMDLAPVNALSGFASRCNTHELISTFLYSKDKDVHQQKFTWKRPSSSDPSARPGCGPRTPVHFDTPQLIKLLHSIYDNIFKYDNPAYISTIGRTMKPEDVKREFLRKMTVCPSHEVFILLLEFLRTSLPIPEEQWVDVVRSFIELHLTDLDFMSQLLRYGLRCALPSALEDLRMPTIGRLSHWKSVSLLIRVFLVVPRPEFAKLERVATAKGMPLAWLRCQIKPSWSSDVNSGRVFHCVDAAYGTLVDIGTATQPDVSFSEDPNGRKGGADLVFSFVVASLFLLAMVPTGGIFVELCLRSDLNAQICAQESLGPELCLFRANLEDKKYVHLVPEQPLSPRLPDPKTMATSRPQESSNDTLTAIGRQLPVRVDMDAAGKHVVALTARLEITNTTVKAVFTEGAMPDVSQCSPCAIQIVLGGCTQKLVYPMPIVGSQRKLRLARKSSYIEVVVPVAISFLQPDGLKMNPFPVVRYGNGSLFPWNLHRVVLDQLPVLNAERIDTARLKEWYELHLGSQISQRNREDTLDPGHANSDVLVNIKHTIQAIMERAVGMEGGGKPVRVFSLQLVDGASIASTGAIPVLEVHTILFIDKVRFDVAGHAMVCDAFVMHTSAITSTPPHGASPLSDLFRQGFLPVRVPTAATMRAWKQMLPALAERCRTTWTHSPNCEYVARGRIPLALGTSDGDPLCSCGRGKDVEGTGMMKDGVWRKFAPFATRIALGPLFPVPYLEDVFPPGLVQDVGCASLAHLDIRPPPIANGSGSNENGSERRATATAGPVPVAAATCDRCKKRESADLKLLVCSRCKTAVYCSRECQKSDWKTHKLRCHN